MRPLLTSNEILESVLSASMNSIMHYVETDVGLEDTIGAKEISR
jgi:hypothetical protein